MGEVCRPESTHPATRGCTGPSTENCDFIDGMDFAVQEKPMGRYILTSLQKWRVIVSEWAYQMSPGMLRKLPGQE